MRKKDCNLMQKIKKFTEEFYIAYKRQPSLREISEGLEIGKTTVYRYLHAMNDEGMLMYNGTDGVVTDLIRRVSSGSATVAVLGNVSCGIPKYAEENIDTYLELPRQMLGDGNFFILRASGDSMVEAGIEDGDFVVIRQQSTAEEGDIVVALLDDEATLKTYYRDNKRKCIRLHPENRKYKDILTEAVIIQGVAIKIIKDLK
ncbi:MAG: transcriptional repressor LexA [Clostridiales bacterium]|nr:transcriptional repressor LexA [Clostridiales bacterium]